MRLVKAEVILTKVPTRRAHKMAIGTTTFQEGVYLRLFDDEGCVGLGEAPHMVGTSFAGETQSSVALQLRERLLPLILGKDPMQIEARQYDMDRALPRNPRAKSAINIALYDLIGKRLKVPTYQLLGGLFRDRVPLSWSIGTMPPDQAAEEARDMVGRGIGILKLKVGAQGDVKKDVAMGAAVAKAVGDKVHLRADANGGYDVPSAIRATRALEEHGLQSMEQPVKAADLEGMARVRRSVTCYVIADESANSPEDIVAIAKAEAADIASIYINNGGGIGAAKRMAIIAEAAGIKGYIGGALEGPIAARACLHFGASSPNVDYGCEMVGPLLLAEDLGTEPIGFEGGALMVPTGHGLGGDLDEAKVKKYELSRFEVKAG